MICEGTIYAHVFENAERRISRSLFWAITLNVSNDSADAGIRSATCEWLNFNILNWKKLDGFALKGGVEIASAECSYYLQGEHFAADLRSLTITDTGELGKFLVKLSLDVPSSDGVSPLPPLDFEGVAAFQGYIVVPANLTVPPQNEADATSILAEFADVTLVERPRWDRFGFVFEPRRSSGSDQTPRH